MIGVKDMVCDRNRRDERMEGRKFKWNAILGPPYDSQENQRENERYRPNQRDDERLRINLNSNSNANNDRDYTNRNPIDPNRDNFRFPPSNDDFNSRNQQVRCLMKSSMKCSANYCAYNCVHFSSHLNIQPDILKAIKIIVTVMSSATTEIITNKILTILNTKER